MGADKTWQNVEANDRCQRAESIEPLVVAYRSGAAVRLSDVADTEDSMEDLRNAGVVERKAGGVGGSSFVNRGRTSSRPSIE